MSIELHIFTTVQGERWLGTVLKPRITTDTAESVAVKTRHEILNLNIFLHSLKKFRILIHFPVVDKYENIFAF